ncbi:MULTISPECIES: hypothetical protein [unclassified Nocardioides]|uniref:hypothetical protein n=1 Tax=unclassified Nocardioides TaxID=2615069 RepID=UPI002665838C|nr:hypothetical protein [Nocardioides sp. Arc9.136]WKN46799.1 hypothetical protein OSR43_12185 [Nocardioides sp. Arc9.136]
MRTRPRRTTVSLVPLVAALLGSLLLPLTACSQDPFEAYCDEVLAQREDLSEAVADGGPGALVAALPHLEALEEEAPRDIRDEWDLVVGRVGELRDALEDAGVDPASYDREDRSTDVSAAQRARIDAAARELAARPTVEALAGVQQQARDVCGTPLTL